MQLISKLLKYRGREDLLKPFLEKYNLPNIALEQIWESADSHIDKNKRIDILNELVRAFGVVDIYDYPTLKGSGLLSYVSLNSGSVSSAVAENKKGASGSLSSPVADNKGGIAFNALPIQNRTRYFICWRTFPGSGAFKGDLNAEWGKIQQLFNSGIRPSIQRISEYTAAAAASPLAGDKIDQVRSMLADMLRREEEDEKLPATEPALKSLISALEA